MDNSSSGVGVSTIVTGGCLGTTLFDQFLVLSGFGGLKDALTLSSDGDASAISGVVGGGTLLSGASSGTAESSGTGGEEIFDVWEDSLGQIHIKKRDATPYCRVEKNAAKTYDALHGQKDRDYKFPAAVVETKEAMDAFADVFGTAPSPRKLRETLDTLERVLEKQTDERGS